MRKGRRFTPQLLDKWEKQGRGQGIYSEYQPFHQVSRGDPASLGRSYQAYSPLTMRHHHHLSDGEHLMFAFSLMIPNVIDIREQFKLDLDRHLHALSLYSTEYARFVDIGTQQVATQLGIKHPTIQGQGVKASWRLTTDFLITLAEPNGSLELIAVAYKTLEDLQNPRKRDLLRIEQSYWQNEGVEWLLITPQQFSESVALTVRRVLPYVIHPDQVLKKIKQECARIAKLHNGEPLSCVLQAIQSELAGVDANCAFYQAVWSGLLPLDLSRTRFNTDPMRLLSEDAFRAQNPIMVRRTAWL